MQGFFVHASGNSTFRVNNYARIHSGQPYYKQGFKDPGLFDKSRITGTKITEPEKGTFTGISDVNATEKSKIILPLIRLEAGFNGNTDETVIRFYEQAGTGFDDAYDAYKLFGSNIPQVYTTASTGEILALNTLPDCNKDVVIPLHFVSPEAEQYSLTLTLFENFESGTELYLEDLLTGNIQNLTDNPLYNFVSSPDDDPARFLLHFSNPLDIDENVDNKVNIYAFGHTIFIDLPEGINHAGIQVLNMIGQQVYTGKTNNPNITRIDLHTDPGYYIVTAQTEQNIFTGKVFIK